MHCVLWPALQAIAMNKVVQAWTQPDLPVSCFAPARAKPGTQAPCLPWKSGLRRKRRIISRQGQDVSDDKPHDESAQLYLK